MKIIIMLILLMAWCGYVFADEQIDVNAPQGQSTTYTTFNAGGVSTIMGSDGTNVTVTNWGRN